MEQELVKKLIGNFFTKYKSGKVFFLTHFIAMGVPKSTVYRLRHMRREWKKENSWF